MELDQIDLSDLLELETDEREAHRQIAKYCRIDLAALDTALERHPALFGYSVACHEMAKVRESQAKWDLEVALAQAFEIVTNQDAKLTATAADRKIKMVPIVQGAAKAHRDAMVVCSRLKGLVNGLEHRRDMLVQIASKQRKESYG